MDLRSKKWLGHWTTEIFQRFTNKMNCFGGGKRCVLLKSVQKKYEKPNFCEVKYNLIFKFLLRKL